MGTLVIVLAVVAVVAGAYAIVRGSVQAAGAGVVCLGIIHLLGVL